MCVARVAAAPELALSNTYMHQDTCFNEDLYSKIRLINYNSGDAQKVEYIRWWALCRGAEELPGGCEILNIGC